MKRRIFVGIPIGKELQEEIFEWEKPFSKINARWMPEEKLYVTLIPSWYEHDVDAVKEKLRKIGESITPFSFQFNKVTYGPSYKYPRLIWAIGKAPKELLELITKLYAILGKKKTRPYRLHLTIARFRTSDFSSFPIKNLEEDVMWEGKITSVNLVESFLLPRGAKYQVLLKVPFKK